jgi:hypothetical protein
MPTICGIHDYMGFRPCPRCCGQPSAPEQAPGGRAPVILNGERVQFSFVTKSKPRWIPLFLWNRLCRLVIRNIQLKVEKEIP